MTDLEIVRLKIGDSDSALFTDAQVLQFISDADDDLNLAAAALLECIAADSFLLDKMVKIGNYAHDRRGMTANLLKVAAYYRETAKNTPAYGAAEIAHDTFSRTTIVVNRAKRSI